MEQFIVEGGYPLRGVLRPAGNKNAALPMLAAALLTDEPVVLENVPEIDDVRVMLVRLAARPTDPRTEVRRKSRLFMRVEPPESTAMLSAGVGRRNRKRPEQIQWAAVVVGH